MKAKTLTLTALPDIPDVYPGDNLAHIILESLASAELTLQPNDILTIAQKIISKAENRILRLSSVVPGARAIEVADYVRKDPRLVQMILDESQEISRMAPGVLIVRHRLGFVSANAGIDHSNVGSQYEDSVLLLPLDPDNSAQFLHDAIFAATGLSIGIVITDSHGRPFRMGTVGVAIGVAGQPALWDRRGEHDRYGYELKHTDVGVADELAAAAGLLMGQAAEGTPVVLIRGLQLPKIDGKAEDLCRSLERDLYR